MDDYLIRSATLRDIDFVVETIINANKSGTDKIPYATNFGLSEEETRKYIAEMLSEEVDDCELSLSGFLVAEKNNKPVAAVGAWIEGMGGIPSSFLMVNLLHCILPKRCIEKAFSLDGLVHQLLIEYVPNTIQIGWVYVDAAHRGQNLAKILIDEEIRRLLQRKPEIADAYIQVFGGNISAVKAYEKANFEIVMVKECLDKEVIHYLPSDKKILMKRVVSTNKT